MRNGANRGSVSDKNVFALNKIPSNKGKASGAAVPANSTGGPSRAAEKEFVEAAKTHTVPAIQKPQDWRGLDPDERLSRGVNVRFNDYELALLRHLAEAQDRSLQQTIKRLLMPAAHAALEE
jgi:hypothetical protein